MASPVSETHGPAHMMASGWIFLYQIGTPGLRSSSNGTVRLDGSNQVQPDVLLRIARGGRSSRSPDNYVEGPPELVVEIAVSTSGRDLGEKKELYRRLGVLEYLAWRVDDRAIDWFRLEAGRYLAIEPDGAGVARSLAFPGLWLDIDALIREDLAGVAAAVGLGLASAGHAAFVARMAADPA